MGRRRLRRARRRPYGHRGATRQARRNLDRPVFARGCFGGIARGEGYVTPTATVARAAGSYSARSRTWRMLPGGVARGAGSYSGRFRARRENYQDCEKSGPRAVGARLAGDDILTHPTALA